MDYLQLFYDIRAAIHRAAHTQRNNWRRERDFLRQFGKFLPQPECEHAWWIRMADRHTPHPGVIAMLEKGYRAVDMHRLGLELAHVSTSDMTRIAYFQSEEKAKRELWTVTSVGKYLTRNFPSAPDHVIRDVAALSADNYVYGITTDMHEMVEIVMDEDQVWSCMGSHNHDNYQDHPYRAYDPRLGWALAYRRDRDGSLQGRALTYTEGARKCFVRTYTGDENHATNDIWLERWLINQGYTHEDGWPRGAKLRLIEASDDEGYLAPYLDGDNDHVVIDEDDGTMEITRSNGVCLDSQHGRVEMPGVDCPHCGCRTDADNLTSYGRYGDGTHCNHCEDDFTLVEGPRGAEYEVPNNEAVEAVDGTMLDRENLPSDYVMLDCGRYEDRPAQVDDTVVDCDGKRWHERDITETDGYSDRIIWVTAGNYKGSFVESDNAFKCAHTGDIYSLDDGYETDGDDTIAAENWAEWLEAKADAEPEDEPAPIPTETHLEVQHAL